MSNAILVYDGETDELTPVTQNWCDEMQIALNVLGMKTDIIKAISSINPAKQPNEIRKLNNFFG